MRAVLHRRFGAARDVLETVDGHPTPVPGREEILVRVCATSVNPIDCAVRRGYGAAFFRQIGILRDPHIPGRDVAGEVVVVGEAVRSFGVGDRVWAGILHGASADYAAIPEAWAARVPDTLAFRDAAAIPFAGLTAWTALVTHAGLSPANTVGTRVIVPRGAGGVGSFAIQLLKAWGAHVATIVSERNAALVRSLGADVIVDRHRQDIAETLHDYDVAFDTSFGTEPALLSALKTGADAAYVSVVSPKLKLIDELGLAEGEAAGDRLFAERTVEQARLGRRYAWSFMRPDGAALQEIGRLVEAGKIRPVIDSVHPLADLATAHEHCESGHASGKIIVTIDD